MISVEKTKNGLETLKYNKKYLHSKYDPLKEAKTFIESKKNLLEKDIAVVLGSGLGYHINEILNRGYNGKIIVFEYSSEILSLAKKNIVSDKVEFINGKDSEFMLKLQKYFDLVEDIIIHKPSFEVLKDENISLYNLLKNFEIQRNSIEKQKDELLANKECNLQKNYEGIENILDIFDSDKAFLVVAAGPSLDFELEFIKKHREKFNIISVGSAFKSLINAGVKPDAIVIIDAKPWVKNQLDFYDENDIPLCFLSTASRWAVDAHKGEKYIFFNDEKESKYYINTGKTVAVAATDIAIKSGAKKVVFVGQDLAYLDNKTHTNTFESIYGYKDVIYKTNDYREVKSVNGKILQTTEGFLYFKKQLEKLVEYNKNIEFYNISKGAYINGAKNLISKKLVKEINF
ncbi:MAG: 6-hydroxymethylpterin diphosphokinase MptE-like protein [Sarcina sp.]